MQNGYSPPPDYLDRLISFSSGLLENGRLEVIVKYNGDITVIQSELGAVVELLGQNYAVITGTTEQIKGLYSYPQIEYVELPKTLTYELSNSRYSVCVTRAQGEPYRLTGKNTAIGIIDSGIDYTHPDFITDDGKSRILYIWDQTRDGNAPLGFRSGYEYTNEMLNDALSRDDPYSAVNFRDEIGHGTAVAGIAAGNGRSSNGRERGISPEASLIIVKLGRRGFGAFPRTTELMRGIKYIIDKARELSLPLSINISYGTNDGSHDGNSLFEQYVNEISGEWKSVICVASGNEGDSGHHYSSVITQGKSTDIPFSVTGLSQKIYMTLWKSFSDDMTFRITNPNGESSEIIYPTSRYNVFSLGNTDITVLYGQPTVYTQYQEVFFLFEAKGDRIDSGVWTLGVSGENITSDGRIDIWLPTVEDVSKNTAFSTPDPNVTLTLPSTSERVISVGGYDANTNTASTFSGRGYTRNNVFVKPDITAPAVNVLTTKAGGGYDTFTGTSISAPFVTGAVSLMMEWGIVQGNDIFLYGQRVKAFLQKGARRTQNIPYPNNVWGYGTLCIGNTLDLLSQYDP